jgi:hypothetical protein
MGRQVVQTAAAIDHYFFRWIKKTVWNPNIP